LVARDDGEAADLARVHRRIRQDGTPNPQTPTTAVRMRLAEHDGRTRMELRFIFESREHMTGLERWGAFEVFPQSVGQMDALLPGGAADDRQTRTS
jgi:hypothetical protein